MSFRARSVTVARDALAAAGRWAKPITALLLLCAVSNEGIGAPASSDLPPPASRDVSLLLSEGTWMSVDVSPDGNRIVFDLLGDIYAMPSSGGVATPLHSGPAMQRSAKFSPDGKSLLFISDADGADNIWLSSSDGSAARQVSRETSQIVTGPAWSSDGKSVAAARMFAGVDKLHASELRSYDLASGSSKQLVDRPANGENVHQPVFSPDGRYVYYTEKVSPPTASVVYIDANHINYAIKRLELATGKTEELVKGFGSAHTPALSPDGRRIAFVRRVGAKTVLFTYDIASRQQLPVFDGLDRDGQSDFIGQGEYYPSFDWFPDSRSVAIWFGGKLHRIDATSGKASAIPFQVAARHRLIDPPRFGHDLSPDKFQLRAIRQFAIDPRGRSYLFNGAGELWQQEAKATQARRLVKSAARQSEPAFSPDGSRVAYVEWTDEGGASLNVRSRTGRPRQLVRSAGALREPIFSADGKHLLYRIDKGDRCLGGYGAEPGIYSMPASGGESRLIRTDGEHARLSPDGQRLAFVRSSYVDSNLVSKLESARLDGSEPREHAVAPTGDTTDLRISPNFRWVAYKHQQQYYLEPLPSSAASVRLPSPGAVRLSQHGGYELAWAADSGSVYWLLGPTLYRHDVGLPTAGQPAAIELNAQVQTDRPQGAVALVNGRIVTMRGDEVIARGTVVIRDNRIENVGPADQVRIPNDAKVVDVAGKVLMPGLIDMHGHIDVCYYGSTGVTPQKQAPRYAELAYGVTTNYDPYSTELPAYAQAEMTRAGRMVGPRAIDAGMVAYGRQGKSDAVFLPVNGSADAEAIVARKTALGGSIIKSYRQPMRRQRQLLLEAARKGGIMMDVEGESNFQNNLTMVLDGHTNLQHNMPVATLYDDVVQLIGHSKVAHTPTLMALFGELMGENYLYQTTRAWEEPKARTFVQITTSGYSPLGTPYGAPPYVRGMTTIHVADELWNIGFRSVARSMKKLDDQGALINAGSHGQFAGLGLHWEMWLLAEGGMSNHRVLRTATINGATTLGLDRQIGTIEAGKLADIIVLDKDPLVDIRNTNSVRFTMINGRLYDANTVDEIGNYNRRRGRFYWEVSPVPSGIDWESAWTHE